MFATVVTFAIVLVVALSGVPVSTRPEAYMSLFMALILLTLRALGRGIAFREPGITPIRVLSVFIAIFLTTRYLYMTCAIHDRRAWRPERRGGALLFGADRAFGRPDIP